MTTTVLAERALQKNEWPLRQVNELTLVLSPLLAGIEGLTHAFTTRLGAASPEPLDWFNLGRHWNTEESRQDAMQNRKILCDALNLDAAKLVVPGQQHTTNIFIADQKTEPGQQLQSFDGVLTKVAAQPLLLHFADCVPVMIFDRKQRVLCVMHAGWRGTAGGIVSKGVKLVMEQFGARAGDICAAVGPAIGSCCYETGADVAESLSATVSNAKPLIEWKNNKPYPDLKALNAMQLLELGVGDVDVSDWCTACRPDLFYSHRQSGGQTGRQGALACMTD